jgi:iron complex outermembrane receptor protein
MIRTKKTKFGFLRTALAVGVAIPILAGAGAFAQAPAASPTDQSPLVGTGAGTVGAAQTGSQPAAIGGGEFGGGAGATAETERIIVTGSNIPTAQEVGPNPVLNINRDLINKSGERTAEALIKDLPIANGGGVPISNNGTGFTPGASAISLRGLGPQETLLLIDGRRVAPYPIGNGGTSSFFDLRSIPEAAIESIEVLKDGASTTYGADAVAGVVNIKLRHDYKGVQAQVGYGNTLDKDSGEVRANVVFGIGDGNTNVTGVIDYYHRNSIFNRDRGYSAVPPFLSSNSTPENLSLTFDQVVAAGGTPPDGFGPVGNPDDLPSIFFGHAPFGSNGLSPASAYTYTASRSSVFNFNQFSSSYPQIENWGGLVAFDHKWFGDQLVIYGDMYYQQASSHDELAPSATGSFQTAGQVTLAIPPNSVFLGPDGLPSGVTPPSTPTFAETGLPIDAFNPFNPFQQIISGASRARLLEFGNRLFDNQTDSFLVTLGARGDKLFDGTWGYDFGFRYSNVKATSTSTLTSTSRFNQILNQNDPIFQPGGILAGEPAFNPFGDALGPPIPANAATTNFATVHPKDVDTSELGTLDLNIYTTELFKLPAGGIGFAFGGQFRKEQLTQDIDQLSVDGDLIGNSPGASTQAGRKDWALYAEASVPFFSPTFNVPGAYALEFTAAVRYEVFENNSTNVAVPKFGMRWQPFDETFTVRATWGEGFREPSLIELYASPTSGLTASQDILPTSLGGPATPVLDENGQPNPARFEPETPVVTTSSPVLQPEDSRSFSAGIVWTPKWVNGLTLSVDLWNIEQTGVVVASTTNQVLQNELNNSFAPGESVERNADGTISRIFTPFVNSGNTQTNGIDMGLQYVYPTKYGTFTSVTNATWVNTYQMATFANLPQKELNGYTTDPGASNDGYLKWKGVSRLDWAWNGWDLVWTTNFLDGFHDRKPNGTLHYTSQTWFFDGQLSYDFTFVPPVENQPVAGYSKDAKDVTMGKDGKATESAVTQTATVALPIWKQVLNGTTITLGCNDIFGQDPPTAYGFGGNSTKYPGFLYDATGRFVYVQLTKKF